MAIDDTDRTSDLETSHATGLDDQDVRDLAMREALGLLDEIETLAFERMFEGMTPDDQAAVLDLQAAVVREIAGAGDEDPDRSLRYRVLARLTEEMASDPASRGPLAVIGAGTLRPGRSSGGRQASADAPRVSELQFDRIRRSAGVWRAAAFAMGSAVLALGLLQYQAQNTINLVVDRLGDQVITDEVLALVGEARDLDRYIDQGNAEAWPLIPGPEGAGTGFVFVDPVDGKGGTRQGVLVALKQPSTVQTVTVVAILPGGGETVLNTVDIRNRHQLASIELDLSDLPEGFALEVRNAATGVVLLRTA